MSIAGTEPLEYEKVVGLLGGSRVLGRSPRTALDAHDLLVKGLPNKALDHLVSNFVTLQWATYVELAMGMSLRTYQRRKEVPAELLSQEQSGRTWKFAEILSRATDVLGSQEEAELWLERPAIGLDQRRPIELLATPAGVELVEDHLTRLEYGVYA